MSLQNLLDLSAQREIKNSEVTEERVRKNLPELRNMIAFYRMYPDIFIDEIKGPDCIFKFYLYQRVFLRAVMRYKWVYAVFPRA